MELLERGDVAATVDAPVRADSLRHVAGAGLDGLVRAGPWVFSSTWLDRLEEDLRARLTSADPIDPGVPAPADSWAADVLPLLPFERRGAKLYLPGAVPTIGSRADEAAALEAELDAAGMRATKIADSELTRFLEKSGRLVRLGDGYAIGTEAFVVARDVLLTECRTAGGITLGRFRDLVGTGRRDAQLLLERFDADGLTRREQERRVLRRKATEVTSRPSA
jgi:hypothetical protein